MLPRADRVGRVNFGALLGDLILRARVAIKVWDRNYGVTKSCRHVLDDDDDGRLLSVYQSFNPSAPADHEPLPLRSTFNADALMFERHLPTTSALLPNPTLPSRRRGFREANSICFIEPVFSSRRGSSGGARMSRQKEKKALSTYVLG